MTRHHRSSTLTTPFRVRSRRVLRLGFCRQLDVVWRRVKVDSKNLNKTDFFRCDGNFKQTRLLLGTTARKDKICNLSS